MKKLILICLLFFVTVGGFADPPKRNEYLQLFSLPTLFEKVNGRSPEFQNIKPEEGLGYYNSILFEVRGPLFEKENHTITFSCLGHDFFEFDQYKEQFEGAVGLSFGIGVNYDVLWTKYALDGLNFCIYPVYQWFFYTSRKTNYYKWKCAANLGYLYTTKLGIAIYPYCQSILGFTPDGVKGCVDLGLSVGFHFGDL